MIDPVNFLAYAREVRVGDELDGEEVTAVDVDEDTVSISLGEAVQAMPLEAEVMVTRERAEAFK